jgi:hypothetical protein
MELKDRLEFCRKCTKREENSLGANVCSLTHAKPTFDYECIDYTIDPNEPEKRLDDGFVLSFSAIKEQLESTVYAKFILDQKYLNALIYGFLASIVGALVWAVVSIYTKHQFGYLAIGVGALVGFTIKYAGKGFELKYSLLGAFVSLFGCLLGNLLTVIGFTTQEYQIGFWQIISTLNLNTIIQVMIETFKFMDIVFYGLAIYEGFRFSTMKFTEKSLWLHTNKYR